LIVLELELELGLPEHFAPEPRESYLALGKSVSQLRLVHGVEVEDDLIPKTETNLTADYSHYTDTIGYDYQCPEVWLRNDSYIHPPDNSLKICEIRGICGFNSGI
jgi:hypothetical protein